MRDLILHLVASHHGYCRALPSVVIDDEAECVKFKEHTICRSERLNHPPHSLGYGISDRFWRLTRQYGWWGLAYLEAMLRLADWQASEERGAEV